MDLPRVAQRSQTLASGNQGATLNESLLSGVKRHDVELVKRVLCSGADVDFKPAQAAPTSISALRHKITSAYAAGLHDYSRDWSALHEAVGNDYGDLAELLLAYSADVNVKDSLGNTPLHLACVYGRSELTKLLLESKADPAIPNLQGVCPLHYAAMVGDEESCEALLFADAPTDSVTAMGWAPLHVACMFAQDKIALLLLLAGANPNQKDSCGATPLYYACASGAIPCYEILICNSANVLESTAKGDSCLSVSIMNGRKDITLRLIARENVCTDIKNERDMSPLHFAVWAGQVSCASLLIGKGADPNGPTKLGNTPLHLAVLRLANVAKTGESNALTCIEMLLDKGADWKRQNGQKHTPIHLACLLGHSEALKTLLVHAYTAIRPQGGSSINLKAQTPCSAHWCKKRTAQPGRKRVMTANVGDRAAGGPPRFVTKGSSDRLQRSPSRDRATSPLKRLDSRLEKANSRSSMRAPTLPTDTLCEILTGDESAKDNPLHMAAIGGDVKCVSMILPVVNSVLVNASDKSRIDVYDMAGYTPLCLAAALGHASVVEYLLENGADFAKADSRGRSPLHLAVRNVSAAHAECAKWLLKAGADVDALDSQGYTALHVCCEAGNHFAVSILLKHGASMSQTKTRWQGFPLEIACWFGHGEVIRELLNAASSAAPKDNSDRGPLASSKYFETTSALHISAYQGHKECIEILLEFGADVDQKDAQGRTAMHCAAAGGQPESLQFLLSKGATVELAMDNSGMTPMAFAASYGHFDCVLLLHTYDADVTGLLRNGMNCLHMACAGGSARVTQYLVEKCASNPNVQDRSGRTALHHAAANGHAECIKVLLAADASTGWSDRRGESPLHCAVTRGSKLCATVLIENDKDCVKVANREGNHPLQLAIAHKQFECIDVILKGRSINEKGLCGNNETPLHTAARYGCLECVPILLDKGMELRATNETGMSILHTAAFYDQTTFIVGILKGGGGLDPNGTDNFGRTPLHYAALGRAGNAIQALLNYNATCDRVDDMGVPPILYALKTPFSASSSKPSDVLASNWSFALQLLNSGCSLFHRDEEGNTAMHLIVHLYSVASVLDCVDAVPAAVEGNFVKLENGSLSSSGPSIPSSSSISSSPTPSPTSAVPQVPKHSGLAELVAEIGKHHHTSQMAQNFRGMTPLSLAVRFQSLHDEWGTPVDQKAHSARMQRLIRFLVECGGDPYFANVAGESAISFAAVEGNVSGIGMLLQGAKPDASQIGLSSPLHSVANAKLLSRAHVECVRYLGRIPAFLTVVKNGHTVGEAFDQRLNGSEGLYSSNLGGDCDYGCTLRKVAMRRSRARVEEVVDVPYVLGSDHPKHKLDIYKPLPRNSVQSEGDSDCEDSQGMLPVVIFAHGGGWKRGCRRWKRLLYSGLYRNVGMTLAKKGYLTVVISYRLSALTFPSRIPLLAGMVTGALTLLFLMVKFLQLIGVLDELSLFTISAMTLVASLAVVIFDLTSYEGEGSVKHPDHVDDFTSAYAWVLENIGRYDGDTNNIFLMGHSSGGHLATLATLAEQYIGDGEPPLRGVISLSGVYNLERLRQQPVVGHYWYISPAFGTDDEILHDASPLSHARETCVPFLLLNAKHDFHLNRDSQELTESLQNKGVEVEHVTFNKYNHLSIISTMGRGISDEVTPLISDWINRHLWV